jgi:hypothetical protein
VAADFGFIPGTSASRLLSPPGHCGVRQRCPVEGSFSLPATSSESTGRVVRVVGGRCSSLLAALCLRISLRAFMQGCGERLSSPWQGVGKLAVDVECGEVVEEEVPDFGYGGVSFRRGAERAGVRCSGALRGVGSASGSLLWSAGCRARGVLRALKPEGRSSGSRGRRGRRGECIEDGVCWRVGVEGAIQFETFRLCRRRLLLLLLEIMRASWGHGGC